MKIAIFGASGFSKEVRDIALNVGYKKVVHIDKIGCQFKREFPIVAEDQVCNLMEEGYDFTIGIGNPEIRRGIYKRFPKLRYVNLIDPTATFGYRQLDKVLKKFGNIIFPGARLTNSIDIGNFGIYYLNCTIAHDCIVEDFVTICPGATISGNVKLSKGSFIGANSCILQGKSIDEKLVIGVNSIVGAGAVVTTHIPAHTIVKGIPART